MGLGCRRAARRTGLVLAALASTLALVRAAARESPAAERRARLRPRRAADPRGVLRALPRPGESKALLRLDTAAYFREGGESGAIVVARRSGREPADRRASRTPTRSSACRTRRTPLTPAQIETLRRWIEAGAPWPEGVTVAVAEAREATLAGDPRRGPRDTSRLRYNRDVRPILAESCFPCHGPDGNSRKAGLRLDREEVAKGTLASGTVPVVPGAPDRSGVHDPRPPRRRGRAACRSRRAGARGCGPTRWRRCGAGSRRERGGSRTGPTSRPRGRRLPRRARAGWARNPVDAFVLAGIEAAGLRAVARGLARGAAAPAELRSHRPAAVARGGARLRARRAPGRLRAPGGPPARLAALRRADGALLARPRALLRQRRLPQRQRAADVALPRLGGPGVRTATCRSTASPPSSSRATCCPDAGFEQKIASGYNRLLQTTEEGGAQPKEYRAIYLADRVRNASGVWLGATLGCAQCHDHKFDPYLARDFYAFAAFFADVKEEPVGRRKPDPLPDAAQQPPLDALDARVKELKEALDARSAHAGMGAGHGGAARPALHDARARARRRRRTGRA